MSGQTPGKQKQQGNPSGQQHRQGAFRQQQTVPGMQPVVTQVDLSSPQACRWVLIYFKPQPSSWCVQGLGLSLALHTLYRSLPTWLPKRQIAGMHAHDAGQFVCCFRTTIRSRCAAAGPRTGKRRVYALKDTRAWVFAAVHCVQALVHALSHCAALCCVFLACMTLLAIRKADKWLALHRRH